MLFIRELSMIIALAGIVVAGNGHAEQPSAVQKVPAQVDGFRSAKFGMAEAEVRQAIATDFGSKDVRHDQHPTEKTAIVGVVVDNLLPDTGPALVSYILGFSSHRLTQVNIVWLDKDAPNLANAAMTLRNYFLGMAFRPDSVAANAPLADGTLLVFRGSDQKGRMVSVILKPSSDQPGDGQEKDKSAEKVRGGGYLRLSYIETPEKPDIFSLKPGQF